MSVRFWRSAGHFGAYRWSDISQGMCPEKQLPSCCSDQSPAGYSGEIGRRISSKGMVTE